MHSKVVIGDKTVRKRYIKGTNKIKTPIAQSVEAIGHNKYTTSVSQNCETKLSSVKIRKHSTCQISDSKTTLYTNMKKLLETKYKKITSSTSSREKLSPGKSRYDPKIYNLTKVKEKTPFFRNPVKKISSTSASNTVDSRNALKEDTYLSNEESLPSDTLGSKTETNFQKSDPLKNDEMKTTTEKAEETSIKKKKTDEESLLRDKNLIKNKDSKLSVNSTKGQGKHKKYKISKRLASLAQHKELPIPVKKDLAFKPFKVPKRALLFRATPRILELAKPVPKLPPVDILPPEKVFTVKKRSLKARCSKRISELAFPVLRREDFRIKAEYPFATKRRSLRAKCTKRVKELAKPLPRRCRTPIRKLFNDDGPEG
ncbi:unnamed protein product [Nezara viridula]|uniref:Uncharacterized protein n=1 Tax=Nezara viridula TaxID=85310 RepID=A0A9P0H359_NEZVI|nr:unnamed protein product [Nezara viridula]